MIRSKLTPDSNRTKTADPRWIDLYRIGAVCTAAVAVLVLVAIVAFFIWPYQGNASPETIFAGLSSDRLGTLITLDMIMLVIMMINIVPTLALYVALKEANESYALIALVLAIVGFSAVITARPLAEMVLLSEKHAAATTQVTQGHYLAAGEALLVLFDGTAWMAQTGLFALGGLINSMLMLRSPYFSRTTAWVGIVTSACGLGFALPVVGIPLLGVNTLLTIVFYALVARVLFRLGWPAQ